MLTCTACGAVNPAEHRFCSECGAGLALSCPACGALAGSGFRFCGLCGADLSATFAECPGRARPHRSGRAGGRAAGLLGAVRRSGRLHTAVRVARPRRDPRTAVAVLRHGAHRDHPVRRHGGEVHRRRGHGGLGCAGRRRGRSRAGRTRGHRVGRRGRGAGRGDRRDRPGPARRSRHRRGGGQRGCGRRGDGRRRRGQHSRAGAGGGGARDGLGRHGNPAALGGGRRLRRCRRPLAQGQGATGPAVAGDAGAVQRRWPATRGRSRGAADRPGRRTAHDQGAVPRLRRPPHPAAGADQRRRRRRQGAPRMGVREVRRRARRPAVLASRAVPGLRRGRGVPAARRDGAPALRHRGRGFPRRRGREVPRAVAAVRPGRGATQLRRSAPRAPARPRPSGRRRRAAQPRGPVRGVAAVLRAPGRHPAGRPAAGGRAARRRRAAGLLRAPARLGPQLPDLRARVHPARVARPAPGGRHRAQPHGDGPRPARPALDATPGRRTRPRHAARRGGRDRRAGAGQSAVRRRDGALAGRPRRRDGGGRGVPPGR